MRGGDVCRDSVAVIRHRFWLMTPFCQPALNRVSSARWKRQTPRIRPGDRRMRSPCIPSVLIRPSRLYTTLKRRAYAAVR